MELKEAIDNFNSIIKLYTNLDILNGIEKCKELEAIETVLQALKEKEEINESHQKENGKLQVELSEKDETISVLEFNYKNLNADIGGIAQELGLEEDATIDEMYRAIRELQDKLSKAEKMIDLILEWALNEVISEVDLDAIYGEMNNCCGEERNWCRGDKEEKKMLKQYFKEKVESEEQ